MMNSHSSSLEWAWRPRLVHWLGSLLSRSSRLEVDPIRILQFTIIRSFRHKSSKITTRSMSGFFVVLLFLASGCSRTNMREINEKYKAEIEAVLAELSSVADSMPKEMFDPANLASERADPLYVQQRSCMNPQFCGRGVWFANDRRTFES